MNEMFAEPQKLLINKSKHAVSNLEYSFIIAL